MERPGSGDSEEIGQLVEALRENTRRLIELEELARVGSWEWDVAADAVNWSDQMYRIFGVKPDQFEATFEAYLACLHPDDRPIARSTVEQALRDGQAYAADYRVIWPDGEERWLNCRGRTITDGAGNTVRLLGTAQDITDRKELEASLTHQALHDSLTGLPNRSLLFDRLAHAMQRTLRTHRHTAVFFIDLDRFKNINDGAGHHVGDLALRLTGDRLRATVRQYDTVARYGGDEFVVVAEDLHWPDEAIHLAARLLEAVNAPITHDAGEIALTASIGATVTASGTGPQDVLRDADAAMYTAKQRGGHNVVWNHPPG